MIAAATWGLRTVGRLTQIGAASLCAVALTLVPCGAAETALGGSEVLPASPPPVVTGTKETAPAAIGTAILPPQAQAVRDALATLPEGATDEDRNERAALDAHYGARGYAPLWLDDAGTPLPQAAAVVAELGRAGEFGLEATDFPPPAIFKKPLALSPAQLAQADLSLTRTILKYGRFARGGRITNPSEQLSSYLDRRPKLLDPKVILEGLAAAAAPDAYLRGLHPAHLQFARLRARYLALSPQRQRSAEGKRLLANMEEWRWMPEDLGAVYIWNNLPDFTQRVVKDGQIVREARLVAGKVDKQTPIFTRPLKKITFRPTWIVPDSIKVRELMPDMLRGGTLMRQWRLEVRTKEGEPLKWRAINWHTADIREYDVIQSNGPKSVMGKVKFSFPNQHTVFMHDTLGSDKWMFNASRRTYSHGCMRVQNPIGLAEIILKEDKGWDAERVRAEVEEGPLNNEIALDHKIPIHMTYFTAMVDDNGKLQTFPDVYGHERRITLALEGRWSSIDKGRDHLAPVELGDAQVNDVERLGNSGIVADAENTRFRGLQRRDSGGFLSSLFGKF